MMSKKLFLIFACILLLVTLWPRANKNSNSSAPALTHPNLFFDEKTFNEGVQLSKTANELPDYRITGGIIPHHLFPGFILTDFFNRLSLQNPKTIILIGPNHYERGDFKMLSSLYYWDTPFGVVNPNDIIINDLINSNLVSIDEKVLPNDHSVAGMMPFVKYYLPKTRVVPILVSGFVTQKEAELFAVQLTNYMDKDTVLVAPVDFSHYLNNKEAQEKDKVTLEVIKKFDYRQLFTLNNDYLDSPASIAILLMVMQKLATTKMEVLAHTNSGQLQNNNYIETTSYLSIVYY